MEDTYVSSTFSSTNNLVMCRSHFAYNKLGNLSNSNVVKFFYQSNVSVLTIPKTENNYALRAGTEDAYTHHKTRPIY